MDTADLYQYVMTSPLQGTYSTWCGSSRGAVARQQRHPSDVRADDWNDVDFFFASSEALLFGVAKLLDSGASPLNENEHRKLKRWLRRGMDKFDTHSIRIETLQAVEFNLVFKLVDRKPLRTATEQVNSFDFSNVSMSTDMRTGQVLDLFPYYWPDGNPDEVRMFPDREEQWLTGSISRFTAERQAGRYAINVHRGWDMHRCKDPLVTGYRILSEHYADMDDDDLQELAGTLERVAGLIEEDGIDELLYAYNLINPLAKSKSFADAVRRVKP